jgi:PASTA domain-containing protein
VWRWTTALALCAVVLLVPGRGGATNGVSIQVLDAAGVEDPVEDLGRSFVFGGHADTETNLWVKYRPAGGAPCAPSASSDSGDYFDYWFSVNGDFSVSEARVWDTSGNFIFCMWLANSSSDVTPPYSRVISFRIPNGSATLSTSPGTLRPGIAGTLNVSGTSEASRSLYVTYRASGGAPCAPSPSSDSGQSSLWYGTGVNGGFSFDEAVTFDSAGSYLFCVWLRRYSSDVEPVGGTPASFTVSVIAPPPPPPPPPPARPPSCVVPNVVGFKLPRAKKRVNKSHCRVTSIVFRNSSLRKKGRVLAQTPKAGRRLRNGAAVRLVVGTGRRH